MRPPKEAGAGGFHLVIVRTANWLSGNQDNIPTGLKSALLQTHDFTQTPLDAIAADCVANAAVDSKPKSTVIEVIRQRAQYE